MSTRITAPPVTVGLGKYSIAGVMVRCPAGLLIAPLSCWTERVIRSGGQLGH